jgi:hypothetical protein
MPGSDKAAMEHKATTTLTTVSELIRDPGRWYERDGDLPARQLRKWADWKASVLRLRLVGVFGQTEGESYCQALLARPFEPLGADVWASLQAAGLAKAAAHAIKYLVTLRTAELQLLARPLSIDSIDGGALCEFVSEAIRLREQRGNSGFLPGDVPSLIRLYMPSQSQEASHRDPARSVFERAWRDRRRRRDAVTAPDGTYEYTPLVVPGNRRDRYDEAEYRHEFGYALLNEDVLWAIVGLVKNVSGGRLVEWGARGGYCTQLLNGRGAVVLAFDPQPDPALNPYEIRRSWADVAQDNPSVIADHGDKTLMLIGPLGEQPAAAEAIRFFYGNWLIYLGEDWQRFSEMLPVAWRVDEQRSMEFPHWGGGNSKLAVFHRGHSLHTAVPRARDGLGHPSAGRLEASHRPARSSACVREGAPPREGIRADGRRPTSTRRRSHCWPRTFSLGSRSPIVTLPDRDAAQHRPMKVRPTTRTGVGKENGARSPVRARRKAREAPQSLGAEGKESRTMPFERWTKEETAAKLARAHELESAALALIGHPGVEHDPEADLPMAHLRKLIKRMSYDLRVALAVNFGQEEGHRFYRELFASSHDGERDEQPWPFLRALDLEDVALAAPGYLRSLRKVEFELLARPLSIDSIEGGALCGFVRKAALLQEKKGGWELSQTELDSLVRSHVARRLDVDNQFLRQVLARAARDELRYREAASAPNGTYEATPLVRPGNLTDRDHQAHYRRAFGYAIPTAAALDTVITLAYLASGGRLMEWAARAGYWTQLLDERLKERGGDALAFDPQPDPERNRYRIMRSWAEVAQAEPTVIAQHPGRMLMLIGPLQEQPAALEAISWYAGEWLVYIGEDWRQFHGLLGPEWTLDEQHVAPIPHWRGAQNALTAFRRGASLRQSVRCARVVYTSRAQPIGCRVQTTFEASPRPTGSSSCAHDGARPREGHTATARVRRGHAVARTAGHGRSRAWSRSPIVTPPGRDAAQRRPLKVHPGDLLGRRTCNMTRSPARAPREPCEAPQAVGLGGKESRTMPFQRWNIDELRAKLAEAERAQRDVLERISRPGAWGDPVADQPVSQLRKVTRGMLGNLRGLVIDELGMQTDRWGNEDLLVRTLGREHDEQIWALLRTHGLQEIALEVMAFNSCLHDAEFELLACPLSIDSIERGALCAFVREALLIWWQRPGKPLTRQELDSLKSSYVPRHVRLDRQFVGQVIERAYRDRRREHDAGSAPDGTYKATPLVVPGNLADGQHRLDYRRVFGYAIPDKNALQLLIALIQGASGGRFLEVNARGGYWTQLLTAGGLPNADGLDGLAFDPQPDPRHDANGIARSWANVAQGDLSVITEHPGRTLLLIGPLDEQPRIREAIGRYRGEWIVYVGEDAPQFGQLLGPDWKLDRRLVVPIPHWGGAQNYVAMHQRGASLGTAVSCARVASATRASGTFKASLRLTRSPTCVCEDALPRDGSPATARVQPGLAAARAAGHGRHRSGMNALKVTHPSRSAAQRGPTTVHADTPRGRRTISRTGTSARARPGASHTPQGLWPGEKESRTMPERELSPEQQAALRADVERKVSEVRGLIGRAGAWDQPHADIPVSKLRKVIKSQSYYLRAAFMHALGDSEGQLLHRALLAGVVDESLDEVVKGRMHEPNLADLAPITTTWTQHARCLRAADFDLLASPLSIDSIKNGTLCRLARQTVLRMRQRNGRALSPNEFDSLMEAWLPPEVILDHRFVLQQVDRAWRDRRRYESMVSSRERIYRDVPLVRPGNLMDRDHEALYTVDFGHAIPTEDALKPILFLLERASDGRFIEWGVKGGYWTQLLNGRGASGHAFGNESDAQLNSYGFDRWWAPVTPYDPAIIAEHAGSTLILIGPLHEQPAAREAIGCYDGQWLVYVGQDWYRLRELLGPEWTLDQRLVVPFPHWGGTDNYVAMFRRGTD